MERLIRISPNGEEIIFLYDDRIPWKDLGKMFSKRASDVVFDPDKQKWVIDFKEPMILGKVGNFDSREEAIRHEIAILEEYIVSFPLTITQGLEAQALAKRNGPEGGGLQGQGDGEW